MQPTRSVASLLVLCLSFGLATEALQPSLAATPRTRFAKRGGSLSAAGDGRGGFPRVVVYKSPYHLSALSSRDASGGEPELKPEPEPSVPKIIIAGAPASGKGTQCELIVDKFGVVHLSTGDILRAAVKDGTELGKAAQGFMDRGELVPDDVIIGVVQERLAQPDCEARGWLLDGFPRTKAQADALVESGCTPDSFLLLNVPDEDLVARVVGRRTDPETGKIYHMDFAPPPNDEVAARLVQRSDDTEEKIKVRVEAFHEHCDAVMGCFKEVVAEIDGTQSKTDVFKDVSSAVAAQIAPPVKQQDESGDLPPSPPSPPDRPFSMSRDWAYTAPRLMDAAKKAAVEKRRTATASPNSLEAESEEEVEEEVEDDADARAAAAVAELKAQVEKANKPETGAGAFAVARSVALFVVGDFVFRRLFVSAAVPFPSALGGMLTVWAGLLALDRTSPGLANKAFTTLEPGASFLSKWLAVFFVPSLVVLPLTPAPHAVDFARLALLTVTGWVFSVVTTGWFIERVQGSAATARTETADTSATRIVTKPPFSHELKGNLSKFAIASGLLAVVLERAGSTAVGPVRTAFAMSATLSAFVHASLAAPGLRKLFHPILLCVVATIAKMWGYGQLSGSGFTAALEAYRTGTIALASAGAGDLLLFMLGPSVLSLSVHMFRERSRLSQRRREVFAACFGASVLGLYGTALLARLTGLSEGLRMATVSRQLTTPLAMAVADMFTAERSLAVALVVITGLLGSNFGAMLFDKLNIKSSVSRGLTMGSTAHGLGTAALAQTEPEAFAFSAIAMALTGTITTALVTLDPVRRTLLHLAGVPCP